jgi:hypothetical protein
MWTIDPDAETVTVWTSVSDSATYAKGQTFVPGDILPGLQLPVADLFPQA